MTVTELRGFLSTCDDGDEVCVVRYLPKSLTPQARVLAVQVLPVVVAKRQTDLRRIVLGTQTDPWADPMPEQEGEA